MFATKKAATKNMKKQSNNFAICALVGADQIQPESGQIRPAAAVAHPASSFEKIGALARILRVTMKGGRKSTYLGESVVVTEPPR